MLSALQSRSFLSISQAKTMMLIDRNVLDLIDELLDKLGPHYRLQKQSDGDDVSLFGNDKNGKAGGLFQGLSMLLEHHLRECTERYKQYMERHDEMWRKLEEIERHREIRWAELQKELNDDLERQMKQMRSTVWKVVGLAMSVATIVISVIALVIHVKIPN